jgi:hypothetical protein
MAFAVGTADGFVDMLKKLRDYADGTLDPTGTMGDEADFSAGASVPTAQQWFVEKETIPESGNATDGEVYLRGPGGGSDEIFLNIKTYRDTGLFNWEIRGALAFNGSDAFEGQLQTSDGVQYALLNSSMDIWFFVNGRRIIAVAQIGSNYSAMYGGFFNQYATSAQYPYPMLVGGSVTGATIPSTNSSYDHSCMPDPCDNGAQVRWVDGTWYEVRNYTSGGASRSKVGSTGRAIWPYAAPDVPGATHSQGTHNLAETFYHLNIWGQTAGASSPRLDSSFTGERTVYPTSLQFAGVAPDDTVVGELDGMFAVYAESGDTAESEITVGGDTYITWPNTWRTEPFDWFSVKKE